MNVHTLNSSDLTDVTGTGWRPLLGVASLCLSLTLLATLNISSPSSTVNAPASYERYPDLGTP